MNAPLPLGPTRRTVAVCLLIMGALTGCGSGPELPKAAGGGTDELRRSPCACIDIPQAAPTSEDLQRYRSISREPIARSDVSPWHG